jgi:methylated-DNA-protein-cysteine methyltransferase-like protein
VNDDPADSSERQTEAVYAYVRSIPPGRVLSYGDVGQAVGVGARSVGWALSFCPPDVPWQRVVGADGYLRIAKRSPHLKLRQKQLLEGEGVVFDDKERVERRFFLDAAGGDEAFPSLPQTELTL